MPPLGLYWIEVEVLTELPLGGRLNAKELLPCPPPDPPRASAAVDAATRPATATNARRELRVMLFSSDGESQSSVPRLIGRPLARCDVRHKNAPCRRAQSDHCRGEWLRPA